jgi:hypothetical protein
MGTYIHVFLVHRQGQLAKRAKFGPIGLRRNPRPFAGTADHAKFIIGATNGPPFPANPVPNQPGRR